MKAFLKIIISKISKLNIFILGIVFVTIVILFTNIVIIKNVAFTGDEPRFVYYSLSFSKTGGFNLPLNDWYNYLENNSMPTVKPQEQGVKPGHSITTPIMLSLLVNHVSFNNLRWSSFLPTIIGIIFIALILNNLKVRVISILFTILIVSMTLPLLPYEKLLYSDIWLFAISSVSLYLLYYFISKSKIGKLSITVKFICLIVTPIMFCFLPFFHLRLILFCLVLFLVYLFSLFKYYNNIELKFKMIPIGVTLFLVIIYVLTQLNVYGSLFSSASAPLKPTIDMFYNRLILSLFDMRHGLLTFSPIYGFSFLQILYGIIKKKKNELFIGILLLSLLIISIWGSASESNPARFWVASMPLLAVGLSKWFNNKKSFPEIYLFIIFALITFINTFLFLERPNVFLDNRIYSYTYDLLFNHLPYLNISSYLPWDGFAITKPFLEISNKNGELLGVGLCILVLILLLSKSKKLFTKIFSALLIMVYSLLIVIFIGVKQIPIENYLTRLENNVIIVDFLNSEKPKMIRFTEPKYYWPMPPYPDDIFIEFSNDYNEFGEKMNLRMTPVLLVNHKTKVKSFRIFGESEKIKYLFENNKIEVFEGILD